MVIPIFHISFCKHRCLKTIECGLFRLDTTVSCRLWLGVAFIKVFALRIGMEDSAACDHCGSDETIEQTLRSLLNLLVLRMVTTFIRADFANGDTSIGRRNWTKFILVMKEARHVVIPHNAFVHLLTCSSFFFLVIVLYF